MPITNYTNIAVVNTRSIRNKTLEFIENVIDNDIQICIVTETWLSDGDDALITECTPQNFFMLPVNRCNRAGGGTALLCNSKMKPRLIRSLTENYFEISEYLIRYQLTNILFVTVYRPPYSQANPVTIPTFLEKFDEYLSTLVQSSNELIIAGDFNLHINDINDQYARRFLVILDSYDLMNHIHIPTNKSGNTIGLIITRQTTSIKLNDISQGSFISDHCFVLSKINIDPPKTSAKTVHFRKTKNLNITDFAEDIKNSRIFTPNWNYQTVDDLVESFSSTVSEILDLHAPLITKTFSTNKNLQSPWYTYELRQIKKEKRQHGTIWRLSNLQTDYDIFKSKSLEYYNCCKETKIIYFSNNISACHNNQKQIYSLINKLTFGENKCTLPDEPPESLAQNFATFFTDKVNNIVQLTNDIVTNENITPLNPHPNSMELVLTVSPFFLKRV